MISRAQAERLIDEAVAGVAWPVERLPVRAALGRVLASPAQARLALPPFDRCAVDGFALPDRGELGRYQVHDTIAAGQEARAPLRPGAAARIMTGAPVPAGTAAVVMKEQTREAAGWIELAPGASAVGQPIPGAPRLATRANIAAAGEDLQAGATVLPAGSELGPIEFACLLAAGVDEVAVAARVRVAVLSTGDELVADLAARSPAQIIDSNGPMLAALARTWGLEVVSQRHVGDDRAATVAAISAGLAAADLLLLTGGVSVGDFDHVPAALTASGLRLVFGGIAQKPGKPTTFAVGPRPGAAASPPATAIQARRAGLPPPRLAFGLPGNPLSAWLSFQLYALRAVSGLTGGPPALRLVQAPLATDFRRRTTERDELVPCRLDDAGRLVPVECHGSAHMLALTASEGLFVVPAGVARLDAGQAVTWLWPRRGLHGAVAPGGGET